MQSLRLCSALCFALLQLYTVACRECAVNDYGAAGDGLTIDTNAVQRAIDHCSDGGVVLFSERSVYLVAGSLTIVGSGIELVIPRTTILRCVLHHDRFNSAAWAMLHMVQCSGCGIRGGGTLEGPRAVEQGQSSPDPALSGVEGSSRGRPAVPLPGAGHAPEPSVPPTLLMIERCSQVVVLDLRVVDLPAVGVLVDSSADVVLQRVTVRSDWFTPGTSGVVVDGSCRVTVTECDVLTADDAVLLRTSSSGSSLQDFVLTASTLQSRSSAVRVGSEVHADIMRVLVADITVRPSHRGLAVQLRDSGSIRDVTFRRVQLETRHDDPRWWGAAEPIHISSLPRALFTNLGKVCNISFYDVACTSCEGGVMLAGAPDSYLSGVRLGNVNITMVQATSVYGGYRDLRPGLLGVVDMTVPPFYARYLTHLSLSRVLLELTRPPRMEWRGLLRTMTSTVGAVDVHDLRVVDDAALPHRWEELEPSVSNRAPHGNSHEADACRPIAWYRTWVCRVLHRWGQLGSGHLAFAFRYVPESLRRGCGEAIAQAELTVAQQRWDELDDTERDLRQHPRYASHVARSRLGKRRS